MSLPLSVLTGFLGSGKTTLLGRMIRSESFRNTAVIINEFGEVGLDHVLVSRGEESRAILLDSGCLCCALDGSLQTTLQGLFYDRERSVIPRFERVVIETSGLADPAPIANTLGSDRFIASHFRLGTIAATVDAVFGARQLREFEEAGSQVAMADRIILTKVDLADDTQKADTTECVRALNPYAPLLESTRDGFPNGQSAGEVLFPPDAGAIIPRPDAARHPDHSAHRHGHVESHGIGSHVLQIPAAVSWPRYAAWVRHVQSELGERLLRMKGILLLDGRPHAVHAVRHLFSQPEELAVSVPPDLVGSVVMITRNVADEELAACDLVLRQKEQ
ncbi:MAG: GTP-binding protein [Steroidobacteraceae bacterium]